MHSWFRRKKRLRADTCDCGCVTNPGLSQIEILSKDQLRLLSTTINILPILKLVRIRVHLSLLKKWCSFFCLVSFDENDNGEIKEPVLSRNTLNNTKDQRIKQHWIEGVFMYFVSPYIFCEGVPSLHSHTSGLSWSGPNYHSSNRPALRCPTQHCSP